MWLLLTSLASASSPPKEVPSPPELLAQVHVTYNDSTPEQHLSLSGVGLWKGRTLGNDASAHRHAQHTGLTPKLAEGPNLVVWLVGHQLAERLDPGDTVVTYALLLEIPPDGGVVKALWYRDSGEVPRSYAWGEGELSLPARPTVGAKLSLSLKDTDYGDPITLSGVIRGVSPVEPSVGSQEP
ncbi:MAG: hypothetical protein EA397_05430 [Deltaproteobacteria bacterium]|nr:MAG: hypothetical protein EA397_05430 [Deltaproteobacteria bacterium]